MVRATFVATTAALAVAASVVTAVTVSATAQAAAGPTVSVWETTADRSKLLAPQTGTTFQDGASTASQTITINPGTTYQSMTGFGASFTDSSAWLVANSPQRNTIMTKLFDPNNGIGLNFLRQPIGASDFTRSIYSYDDVAAGQTDPTLANFSISHDSSYILPILQQARSLNPAVTVMGTAWSPPAWMKSSGSMIGGTLNSANYQAYANYLVKFVQAYQAAGVPVALLTPQNEPEFSPGNYPGSTFTSAQETSFIANNLGPAIASAGLSTKIIGYDHNWDDTGYPSAILSNSTAAQYTAGIAWHCYAGNPSAQTTVHNAYPSKDAYFTECSGSQSSNTANTFSDSLDWQTENLIIGATRNWAKSVVTWNMALDPSGGPSLNCTTCTGAVTVDNGSGSATYNAEYYVLGHASKFVQPGAVRINSNTFGSGNIQDVAFKNPDGSTALIVLNSNTSSAQTFGVSQNGQSFTYTVPAKAVSTFTWPAGSGTGTTDTTAPSTPTNLAAGGTTSTSTNLTWTASTDNVGVTGYIVYRGGTQVGTSTSPGYAATGLTASTAYAFTVRARDAAGNLSAASNTANVTTSAAGGGTTTIDSTKWYQVINTNSSKCLDAAGRGTANGTVLQQWDCTSPAATNQEWQFRATSNGNYQVVNRNAPALAWDVNGGAGATADGGQVYLWTYGGGTNQQWKPVALSTGNFEFVALNSGKCLDVRDVSTSNGAWLQQWACTGGPAQTFRLVAQP
jgi:glucosylceramidase